MECKWPDSFSPRRQRFYKFRRLYKHENGQSSLNILQYSARLWISSKLYNRWPFLPAHSIRKNFSIVLKTSYPAGIYLLKVNNGNTRTRCEICLKLIIKIPERREAGTLTQRLQIYYKNYNIRIFLEVKKMFTIYLSRLLFP